VTTEQDDEALTAEAVRLGLPLCVKVKGACEMMSIGQTKVYELLGDGELSGGEVRQKPADHEAEHSALSEAPAAGEDRTDQSQAEDVERRSSLSRG
jgi:hypothetical protein